VPPVEYEETIAKSFTKAANLRAMLYKPQCPEALKNCRMFFDQLVNRQIHNGTASIDLLGSANQPSELDEGNGDVSAPWSKKAKKLPSDVVLALSTHLSSFSVPSVGVSSSYISIQGLSYSVASRHPGDSQVMIRTSQPQPGLTPAVIRHIFQIDHQGSVETYLLVERLAVANVRRDPFTRYIWPQMGLYDSTGEVEVIDPHAISSHFAQLSIVWEGRALSLVISLSRS
jgi:hypothetical protein